MGEFPPTLPSKRWNVSGRHIPVKPVTVFSTGMTSVFHMDSFAHSMGWEGSLPPPAWQKTHTGSELFLWRAAEKEIELFPSSEVVLQIFFHPTNLKKKKILSSVTKKKFPTLPPSPSPV